MEADLIWTHGSHMTKPSQLHKNEKSPATDPADLIIKESIFSSFRNSSSSGAVVPNVLAFMIKRCSLEKDS